MQLWQMSWRWDLPRCSTGVLNQEERTSQNQSQSHYVTGHDDTSEEMGCWRLGGSENEISKGGTSFQVTVCRLILTSLGRTRGFIPAPSAVWVVREPPPRTRGDVVCATPPIRIVEDFLGARSACNGGRQIISQRRHRRSQRLSICNV